MKWFKHDTDASNDAKLKKLILRYGAIGYAIYFHCLELVAGSISEANITFELEHDAEIIADNLKIKGTAEKAGVDIVNEVMRYIIELGLFESDGSRVTCLKMLSRLDSSMTSNVKMRQMITYAREHHDSVMTQSCKKRLEENRREKKREKTHTHKGKHEKTGRPINLTRYSTLCDEHGQTTVDEYIQRIADYSDSTGKKYKDYAATAANWIRTDIDKGKLTPAHDDVIISKPLTMED